MDFSIQLFSAAGRDRNSLFYKRFLPVIPSLFVSWPIRRQAQHIVEVIIPELLKLPETHALRPFTEPLRTKAEAALAALEARDTARPALSVVNNEIDDWKDSINRLRAGIYAKLLKYAAENGLNRKWGGRFFRQENRKANDEDESAPPPTA